MLIDVGGRDELRDHRSIPNSRNTEQRICFSNELIVYVDRDFVYSKMFSNNDRSYKEIYIEIN